MNARVSMATLLFSASVASVVLAVDGVIEINQTRAMQGAVTPDDMPGFPVTLSQSGSYRLTGNLTIGDPNLDVIRVTVSDVSIDLNGFAIVGPATCQSSAGPATCTGTGTGNGISGTSNAAVTNGTIRGVGNNGISLSSAMVTNVRARGNGNHGIAVGGDSTVSRNIPSRNGGSGISALGDRNLISENNAFLNGGFGIISGSDSTIARNNLARNGSCGISTGSRSKVLDNVSSRNESFGFATFSNTTGYAQNVFSDNSPSDVCGASFGTATEIGTNLCSGSTTCTPTIAGPCCQ